MRMVNVCLIFAFTALGSSLLYSQQAPVLTPEQQQQFDSAKLTVTGYRIITIGQYGTGDSGFGPSSKNWEAAKGYEKINEPDFLRTLGLDKEAVDSQSHQTSKSLLTAGGVGASIVGLAIMLYPLVSPPMTTDQYGFSSINTGTEFTYIAIGAAISLGGAIMIGIGASESPNITPYGRAEALAEKYNAQLLIKITGKDQSNAGSPDSGSLRGGANNVSFQAIGFPPLRAVPTTARFRGTAPRQRWAATPA